MRLISCWHPRASAYLKGVSSDGGRLPFPGAIRAMADCAVAGSCAVRDLYLEPAVDTREADHNQPIEYLYPARLVHAVRDHRHVAEEDSHGCLGCRPRQHLLNAGCEGPRSPRAGLNRELSLSDWTVGRNVPLATFRAVYSGVVQADCP